MRFSEMMGSGTERTSKSRTRSETDAATAEAVVAEALSPYLDAQMPATAVVATETSGATPGATAPVVPAASPEPMIAPLDVATPLDPTAARRAWPVERPVPAPPVEAIVASAAPEQIADFTPLSDDLLPHRR